MNILRGMVIPFRNFFYKNMILNVKRSIITSINVPKYLLDRSRPASEILADLKPEDEENLKNIKIHYEYKLSSGGAVPQNLKDEHHLELLCQSNKQRFKYLRFLQKYEYKKLNKILKKEEKEKYLKEVLNRTSVESEEPVNRFFSKYYNKTIDSLEANRIFQSMVFQSQEIVFDVSYEDNMTRFEVKKLSQQLYCCYAINKSLDEPFQMVISNFNENQLFYHDLVRIGCINKKSSYKRVDLMPWIIEKRHYLDIYPKRKFIYLSPDSKNYFKLGEYDHDAIFIIGAIVDKGAKLQLSLAKAKRENIEHRSFPIDSLIDWKNGSKSLSLNQVMQVISIARDTNGDWRRALIESVPRNALLDKSFLKKNTKE